MNNVGIDVLTNNSRANVNKYEKIKLILIKLLCSLLSAVLLNNI